MCHMLCINCFIDILDDDDKKLINNEEAYIATSDEEGNCERCGEWCNLVSGIEYNDWSEDDDEDDEDEYEYNADG